MRERTELPGDQCGQVPVLGDVVRAEPVDAVELSIAELFGRDDAT